MSVVASHGNFKVADNGTIVCTNCFRNAFDSNNRVMAKWDAVKVIAHIYNHKCFN